MVMVFDFGPSLMVNVMFWSYALEPRSIKKLLLSSFVMGVELARMEGFVKLVSNVT